MKGAMQWVVNTLRAKATAIVQWIKRLGIGIGKRSSETKPADLPPCGVAAKGKLQGKEIHRKILLRVMRDLSEQYYGCGWIVGLEHYLWTLALRQDTEEGQILLYCAEMSGGWWMWDDKQDAAVFVPLPIWRSAYNENEMAESVSP